MINLKELNNDQKTAVEYDDGPKMIVAGQDPVKPGY